MSRIQTQGHDCSNNWTERESRTHRFIKITRIKQRYVSVQEQCANVFEVIHVIEDEELNHSKWDWITAAKL